MIIPYFHTKCISGHLTELQEIYMYVQSINSGANPQHSYYVFAAIYRTSSSLEAFQNLLEMHFGTTFGLLNMTAHGTCAPYLRTRVCDVTLRATTRF